MPVKESCTSLSTLSTLKVSEQIIDCCIKAEKFSLLTTLINYTGKELKTEFSQVKVEYIFPNQTEVLVIALAVWNRLKTDLNITKNQEKTIYLLIHYFCVRRDFNGEFELKSDDKNCVDFLIKYLPNVKKLKVVCEVTNDGLEKILSALKSVVSLELSFDDSEECLPVIGKTCNNLQKLKLSNTTGIDAELAYQFCFPNSPNKFTKSPVCTSLEYLHAKCDDDGYAVLLEYVKNLKALGEDDFKYHHLVSLALEHQRSLFPCSLEVVEVEMDEHENLDFEDMYHNIPRLSKLHVSCIINISSVICNKNLQSLSLVSDSEMINCTVADLPLSFFTPWPKLTTLLLGFSDGIVMTINLSIVSENCRNITALCLKNCKHDTRQVFVPFENLMCLILHDDINSGSIVDVVGQQGPTLKTLGFDFPALQFVKEFLAVLPACKCASSISMLFFQPVLCTKEDILGLLSQFPALTSYGIVEDVALQSDLEQECENRHWDLEFISSLDEAGEYFVKLYNF